MLSKQIEAALGIAVTKAQNLRHEFVTIEHLLYALMEIDSVCALIEQLGGNAIKLRQDLDRFSKYQFGSFSKIRVHGFQNGKIRAESAQTHQGVAASCRL